MGIFDGIYEPYPSERAAFGDAWCGPEHYEHCKDYLVARYETAEDSDGLTCEVYCCAMRARFYTLKALAGANSVGDQKPGFVLSTGSGMAEWAAQTAKHIAEGMVVVARGEAEYAAEYAEKARKAFEASMPPKPMTSDALDGIAAGMAPSGVTS